MFQIRTLRTLLGVNNLPPNTPPNHTVLGNSTVRIPFPCICNNGTGISNRVPYYTVVQDDGLSHIAASVFSGLVEYNQIATVNNITNVNLIFVGQRLWIPLPCSCDDVDGQQVVHYGHVVASGSNVSQIAADFGTRSETLMRLNNMTDPEQLIAGQVLDVPLRACNSSLRSSSPDSSMLLSNGSYVYTANNCVMCNCDASNNYTLQCRPSGLSAMNWARCPAMRCDAANMSLGNSTTSSCNRSTCAYVGYNRETVLTDVIDENTCLAPGTDDSNQGPEVLWRGWSLAVVLLCLQVIMFQRFL